MKIFNFIFIILILIFISGCETPIKSGEIIERGNIPAYQEEVPVVISEIQVGDTSFPIYGSETVYYPESWYFVIQNEDKNGKMVVRKIFIQKDWYDSQKIGDWIELKE